MADRKTVLVTGGAGYIGSHTCKALHAAGFMPVTLDNLVYGHAHAVKWGPLVIGDIADGELLDQVMAEYRPCAVVHFAAYAYVGESVEKPAKYYANNVAGTLSLLDAMGRAGVRNIVFSSSCATYGEPEKLPISENSPQNPINPYGRSKLMAEQILEDYGNACGLKYAALRYFNAAGADADGETGEEHEPEPHLIPRVLMALNGDIERLDVFGDDWDTPDGTCVRDYIHVSDLADGHVRALDYLLGGNESCKVNLGAGKGISIREILVAAAAITGRPVPVRMAPRRAGDPPALYADVTLARELFGFEARHSSVENIISTAWHFYINTKQAQGNVELLPDPANKLQMEGTAA
ncbi:MAG TPA: UDP-glucose 4-epimerase GalE [Rhizobiales bacterium]|nr:UDP-glucose 4-epimerase GalE [Hyphomicrobiales bacterium]